MDGNQVCALIGLDLVQGVGGFGSTVPEALRDLADQLLANMLATSATHRQDR
jgi:hypothetical protein